MTPTTSTGPGSRRRRTRDRALPAVATDFPPIRADVLTLAQIRYAVDVLSAALPTLDAALRDAMEEGKEPDDRLVGALARHARIERPPLQVIPGSGKEGGAS